MLKRLFLALPLLFLVACSDGPTEPPVPSLTGRWQGTMGNVSVDLTLTETNGSISGSGSVAGGTSSIALTAAGTHADPNVSLTLSAAGYEDMNFSGSMQNKDAIDGRLNGSGFLNDALVLYRR